MKHRLGLLAICVVALGCPDDENGAKVDGAPSVPAADSKEFREAAHREAFEQAMPIVVRALEHSDPIAAAQIGRGPLQPTPVSAGTVLTVRKEIDAAAHELTDVDEGVLEIAEVAILRTVRFGLDRANDGMRRSRPWARDPEYYVLETERFVDELERRVAAGEHKDLEAGVFALPSEIGWATSRLQATSPASLEAAAEDYDEIGRRLGIVAQRLLKDAPKTAGALGQCATAATQGAQTLRAVESRLPRLQKKAHSDPMPAIKRGDEMFALPERLGAATLRRRLEVEERVIEDAATLFEEVGQSITRLNELREQKAVGKGSRAGVDAQRCGRAWAPIHAWTITQPAMEGAQFDCAAQRALLPSSATDAELTVALIEQGVVAPTERKRRHGTLPAIALVVGRMAPVSHGGALSIAVASAIKDDAATALVLDRALHRLCLAATALWVHGELGTDEELGPRLRERCPARESGVWIEMAIARPRRAMLGLGLTKLGTGPAHVVALEKYWWAPLGLVQMLADPRGAQRRPKAQVELKTTPLGPGKAME